MELEDALTLTSEAGQHLLESLPAYDEKQAVALTSRLRAQGHEPRLVAAALTQSRLRAKARDKFGDAAASMLFTPDALEQATRAPLAARHAQRFLDADITRLLDGGCGIGADSVQFARAGLEVTAIEADPATATLAQHNLAFNPHAQVLTGLLEDIEHSLERTDDAAWWFDPARRVSGVADISGRTKRTFSLGALSPEWPLVQRLARGATAAGAKLSPSLAHAEIPDGCEAEFVSFGGDVLEAVLWWGATALHAGPTATILKPDAAGGLSALHVTADDAHGAHQRNAERAELGPYLYEADKALTRSGLVGALQRVVAGRELTAGFGYVTADKLVDIGLLGKRYRVLDVVPLHTKTLRGYLREHGIGRVTIKKRDVSVDADQLRRELKLKGPGVATLTLTHLDGARVALVVEAI